jgi:hypothetical protein
MLTIVIGCPGTLFRPPADAVDLDASCDIDAPNVAFSLHKFMINAVFDYILDRCTKDLRTTVFVWDNEIHIVDLLFAHATIIQQIDSCNTPKCMYNATVGFMRKDGNYFALCSKCEKRRSDRELEKNKIPL